jgi:hypothetical protein
MFVLVSGYLFTSFPRRAAGLTQEQCNLLERVVLHLQQADPGPDGWLNPISLELTPFTFQQAWLRRRAADCVTIRLSDCVSA